MKRAETMSLLGYFSACGAAAGLFFILLWILWSIDGWRFHQNPPQLSWNIGLRILCSLVLGWIGGLVAGLILAPLVFLNRLSHRSARLFVAGLVCLLCILALAHTVTAWLNKFHAVTVPHGANLAILGMITVGFMAMLCRPEGRRRLSTAIEQALPLRLTRRLVLGGAISGGGALAAGLLAMPGSDPSPATPRRARKGRNILLVTFDACAAEDMSLYGRALATTPNIAAFARTASVFDNFYSCSTFTGCCTGSLLSGRYPTSTRIYQQGASYPPGETTRNMVRELRAAGYVTAAVVGNPYAHPATLGIAGDFDIVAQPPMWQGTIPGWLTEASRGYAATGAVALDLETALRLPQTVLEWDLPGLFASKTSRYPPEQDFARAMAILEKLPEPFFLWVHSFAPHSPYQPSPPFLHRFLHDDSMRTGPSLAFADRPDGGYSPMQQGLADKARLRYDEWMAQADAAFGVFYDAARRIGKLDNVEILLSADHGESFAGGLFSHGMSRQGRPVIHIPLAICRPQQRAGRRIGFVADQSTIAPTILEMAGIAPPDWMDGKSLLPALEGEIAGKGAAFCQYLALNSIFKPPAIGTVGVIDGTYQFTLDLQSGRGGLRPLAQAEQPVLDISAAMPERAAAMRHAIMSKFPMLSVGAGA